MDNNCGHEYDQWYKERTLFERRNSKQVMWWKYRTKKGWELKVPHRSKAYRVLSVMRIDGKFDVIQMKGSDMYAVGNVDDETVHGVAPMKYADHPGNFLVTNGGFFKNSNPGKYAAVGDTSTTDLIQPIPEQYAAYYERIQGVEDTYLYSGPGLMQPWTARGPDWIYNDETSKITGSLSHASQPNERLALAITKNGDRYIFVYTAKSRGDGLNMRGWRNMILKWFEIWLKMDIDDLQQITNLDGGTSINVFWKGSGERVKRIAQGSIGDSIPGSKSSHSKPIKVANQLVFHLTAVNGEDMNSEDKDEA